MARLFDPYFQAIDGNGNPISGAKLYFYATGTTTPKNTYTTSALSTPNANPVIADSTGRFPPIYLATDVDYKSILKDAADTTVSNGTLDPLLYRVADTVITAEGDLIVGDATGAAVPLPINVNADAALRSNGTTAEWRRSNFTMQRFTSGTGTYTTPANCTAIQVTICGGGGGGGGCGASTAPSGASGSESSFGTITASGGGGGGGNTTGTALGSGGVGGSSGVGTASRTPGGDGGYGDISGQMRPAGGNSRGDGAPLTTASGATAGVAARTNSGGGGGGASSSGTTAAASAGGGGERATFVISHPAASYSYVVGAGGAGGIGTGSGAATGGAGGSGQVEVLEFYS